MFQIQSVHTEFYFPATFVHISPLKILLNLGLKSMKVVPLNINSPQSNFSVLSHFWLSDKYVTKENMHFKRLPQEELLQMLPDNNKLFDRCGIERL